MKHAQNTPELVLDPVSEGDLCMLRLGAYNPLKSFSDSLNYHSILENMRLENGVVWPVPLVLPVPLKTLPHMEHANTITLKISSGACAAFLNDCSFFKRDLEKEAYGIYGTSNKEHPGVASLLESSPYAATGTLQWNTDWMLPYESTSTVRALCSSYKWKKIVGFQTRNPIHKAHAYLIRCALEACDGLLLQPLAGYTLASDIPFDIRMQCYTSFVQQHLPPKRTHLAPLPAPMRYAGPKEAVLHAIIRRNYGCTHFIVGRDHAGVGNFYGTYAAQEIFETLPDLGIAVLCYENAFFCTQCSHMATLKTCPHSPAHHVHLSGSAVRAYLEQGKKLPSEFTYDSIASILASWKNPTP
jgi:sulfate adenylyltransferase